MSIDSFCQSGFYIDSFFTVLHCDEDSFTTDHSAAFVEQGALAASHASARVPV